MYPIYMLYVSPCATSEPTSAQTCASRGAVEFGCARSTPPWPRRGRLRGLAIYRLGAAAPSRIYDFGLDLRNGLDCDLF